MRSWEVGRMIRGKTALLYRKFEGLGPLMESRRGAVNVCRRGSSRQKTGALQVQGRSEPNDHKNSKEGKK